MAYWLCALPPEPGATISYACAAIQNNTHSYKTIGCLKHTAQLFIVFSYTFYSDE